jgi:single stranded DNA-binding protein
VNINRIIISGNLVANPTLRETSSGTPVASATIANNQFFKDTDGQRQQVTTFVDVTVWWGSRGENFAALARKGEEIIVEARAPAQRLANPKTARNISSATSKPKAGSLLRKQSKESLHADVAPKAKK